MCQNEVKKRPPERWRQKESIDLGDQAVLSHPILIIVLTHSGGKYELHNRTFRSERSMSAGGLAISEAPELDERLGVKIGASIFITTVRGIATRIMGVTPARACTVSHAVSVRPPPGQVRVSAPASVQARAGALTDCLQTPRALELSTRRYR